MQFFSFPLCWRHSSRRGNCSKRLRQVPGKVFPRAPSGRSTRFHPCVLPRQAAAFPLRPRGNRTQRAFQPCSAAVCLRRTFHVPRRFLICLLPFPPFREEPSAGNAARRSVAPLPPAVLKTALCYRSISSESVHSRFSASLPVRRVHAGRGGRHKDRGEMIRIFVRRKLPYPLNVSVSDSPATAPPFGTVRTDGECRQHDLDPAQDFLPAPCFLFLSDSAAVRA